MNRSVSQWVLIDYPATQQVVIDAATMSLHYFYWYENTHLEQALDASPVWVEVPEGQLDFLDKYPGAPVFSAPVPSADFIQHVKSLLIMRNPNGKPTVLRFYEPQYLTHWLTSIDPYRMAQLLGPVTEVTWIYKEKQHQLTNPYPTDKAEQRGLAWFQITESDWDQLRTIYRQELKEK